MSKLRAATRDALPSSDFRGLIVAILSLTPVTLQRACPRVATWFSGPQGQGAREGRAGLSRDQDRASFGRWRGASLRGWWGSV